MSRNTRLDYSKDRSSDTLASSARRRYIRRKNKKYLKYKKRRNLSSTSSIVPQSYENTMYSSWFWQNYYNVMEWQNRHQVAYWRSRTIALEHENEILHERIRNMTFGNNTAQHLNVSRFLPSRNDCHTSIFQNYMNVEQSIEVGEEEENGEDEDLEFEITDEMLDFLEQSIRHKMELKRQKEEEAKEASEKDDQAISDPTVPRQQVGKQRLQEMKLLYGGAAPMILGMETAMQLSFDRNCDIKQPKLWPNIPLKL